MPNDAIVTADDLARARSQVRREGTAQLMDGLEQIEPELHKFILKASRCNVRRLGWFTHPQRQVRGTADDLLEAVLICLVALRQRHARVTEREGNDRRIPF